MSTDERELRRRRIGIATIVLVAALFVLELVALATGAIVLALVCAAVLTVGWFVFRSVMRRSGRP